MPKKIAMSDLRLRSLQQADLDTGDAAFNSSANTMMNAMLGMQYGDLYSTVAKTGYRYFETSTTYTTTGGSTITEPVDMLSMVDTIERIVDTTTGRRRRLAPIMAQERSWWSGRTGHARRWELVDDTINLYPTPPSGDQYVLRYIPQPPDLSAVADNYLVDVVTPDGEGFMIWGAAVRFLAKIRSDVTLALQEREAARARLADWAAMRLFNEPQRMIVIDDEDDWGAWDGEYRYDR